MVIDPLAGRPDANSTRLATTRSFTAAESAGAHAHPGASVLMNGMVRS
jgi:hypothetical protein